MPYKDKQIAMRRLPDDTYLLAAMGEEWGLNATAIIRLSLRYTAQALGIKMKGSDEAMIALRNLVAGCRALNVQSLDGQLRRGEKILEKHEARMKRVLKFSDYPKEIEKRLVREERQRDRQARVSAARRRQAP